MTGLYDYWNPLGNLPLPGLERYEPGPPHICGLYDDYATANSAHYEYHRRSGTEPCGKSLAEHAWDVAERDAGTSLPEWRPAEPVLYVCGDEEDATEPGYKHYGWHLRNDPPPCGKARREQSWAARQTQVGHPLPGWKPNPNRQWQTDVPTSLYRFLFEDGDIYWGITSGSPEGRWRNHRTAATPLGRKIRSGKAYEVDVVALYMNRDVAADTERMVIQSGNPFGGKVLNQVHRTLAERGI